MFVVFNNLKLSWKFHKLYILPVLVTRSTFQAVQVITEPVSANKPGSVTSDPVYSYKVEVFNRNKKSDVAVFYLNDFTAIGLTQ